MREQELMREQMKDQTVEALRNIDREKEQELSLFAGN